MVAPEFKLNGTIINPPKNWMELSVECDFSDGEFKGEQISITDFDFVRENYDIIQAWIGAGRIFEGIPFEIYTQYNGNKILFFDGYLDAVAGCKFDTEGLITIKSKAKYTLDWLNDRASSFSFEYLASTGVLLPTDYIAIPYVLSTIPDYEKMAIASISLVFCVNSLKGEAKALTSSILALIANPTSYGLIIIVIGHLAQFVLLMVVIIKLLKQLQELLIQRVKYHKGAQIKKLFERGCQYLGLKFSSTIISDSMVILPKKYQIPSAQPIDGLTNIIGTHTPNNSQIGYMDGTFADFIIKQKDLHNAKVIIDNGTLYFEPINSTTKQPIYKLPPIDNTEYTLNADEMGSNILLSFNTDITDSNTIVKYKGTAYQVQVSQSSYIHKELSLIKGFRNVQFDYALGTRKETLTPVEELFKDVGSVIDGIIIPTAKAVNNVIEKLNKALDFVNITNISPIVVTSVAALITQRIGMLAIEKDWFMSDKYLLVNTKDGHLLTTQPTAKSIYNSRYKDSFQSNQYKLQQFANVPFTIDDYLNVKNNSRGFNSSGNIITFEKLKFNVWNEVAEINTREKFMYAPNLIYAAIEPSGE